MNAYAVTSPSIWLALSGALCTVLGCAAWRGRTSDFPRNFALALFAIAAYSFGYALELGARDLAAMQFALRIEYIGIPFISSIWTLMAYSYVKQRPMPAGKVTLLFAIPVASFVLFQTNDMHHLFYRSLAFSRNEGLAIALIERGPWYYVHTAYSNICFFAYNALLLRSCVQAQPIYRAQAQILLVASLAPWICMLLFFFGITPGGVDLNPFGLAVAGIMSGVAVWRYKFLQLVPMGRDLVFNSVEEGVLIVDEALRIVDFNPAASQIFTALNATHIGTQLAALFAGQDLREVMPADGPGKMQIHTANGMKDYEIKHYPLRGHRDMQMGQAILIQDVSTRVALERKLLDLATHDELTGLHNRRYLMEAGENAVRIALRHKRPLSVLIGDVDLFKQVNDQLGHLAGDKLLQDISACLQKRLRHTDICSRYGGDEFVVVLPETGPEEASRIVQMLGECIHSCTGHHLSIGAASLTPDTVDFRSLLLSADNDLYAHKAARKKPERN